MNGLLIVNGFLKSEKFSAIYRFLTDAAALQGIALKTVTNTEAAFTDFSALKPAFVLFWDKDTCLAQRIEAAGIRVFNSSEAIALCDNKASTALRLLKHGIAAPETIIAPKTFENIGYNDLSFLDTAAGVLGLPMVIKAVCGSFGKQVYLAHDTAQAREIVSGGIGNRDFIMQRFVACSAGRDIRLCVVGNRVVASMLRQNKNGDFRSNITAGGTAERYTPTDAQISAALSACGALGLDFGCADLLFGEDGKPLVCEVNSNPHFESLLNCTGVNMAYEIFKYIIKQV